MKVYWLFLFMSIIGCVVCSMYPRTVKVNNGYEPRGRLYQALFLFGVVIIFCGLRSGVADTPAYIAEFNDAATNIGQMDIDAIQKDKGYAILEILFKQFISTDFHAWLFLITCISGLAIMYTLYKYSIDFGMSFFLYIATTEFTWLMNGMRQYIAISLLFLSVDLLLEKKMWKYILIVALLSTIHGTAIIMLPIYFIVHWKPFSGKVLLATFAIAIIGLNIEQIDFLFDNTQYEGYLGEIMGTAGMNVIRFLVALVPLAICFLARKIIRHENNQLINICVNMDCFNLAIQFAALFVGANYLGRIAAYFGVYTLLLLPWLIKKCFTAQSSMLIKLSCIGFYIVYFYYQMVVTWNLDYISDIISI